MPPDHASVEVESKGQNLPKISKLNKMQKLMKNDKNL